MKTLNLFLLGLCLLSTFHIERAMSAVKYRHIISWSEAPESVYEIEISQDQQDNVIIKKVIKESTYELLAEEPGLYYWRYRAKGKKAWGPYSGYSVIRFKGTPAKEKQALMISPANGTKITYKKNRTTIDFKWDQPDPESSYHLELYFNDRQTPSRVMTVKGGSHSVKLKKIPEKLYWRVFRKKKSGDYIHANKDKFVINLVPSRDDFKPTENFLLRVAMYQAQSEFSFDADNYKKDESFTGQILELNAEYFPKFWNRKRSINFIFRNAAFDSSGFEIGNKKFGLELGMVVGDDPSTHHQFYFGYHFLNNIEMKFGSELDTDYDQGLVSGRYLFRKQFSESFAFEMNTSLQIGSFSTIPSYILQPGLNYLWQDNLWISGFVLFEKYLSEIDDSSRSATVTIEQANSGIGLGLTWLPGK